jgi:hypothetical protein
MIAALSNLQSQIRVIPSVAVHQGKKTDAGTIMFLCALESNQVAVAELPEPQMLTPVAIQEASGILVN